MALDQATAYPDGMKMRAIYMSFSNNHSMYVQLWKPVDDNRFSLKWQRKVHGQIADGMPEVVGTAHDCTHVGTDVRTHARIHARTHTHAHVRTHTRTHAFVALPSTDNGKVACDY